jgi:hypothetical protein
VNAIIAGGFRRDSTSNIPWAIRDGFKYHLKRPTQRIKEINGLVGKYEWSERMFL